MECRNCKHVVTGNYCSNCGQPAEVPRIKGKYILNEVGSVLSFKKGILFTIRELLLNPGKNIRAFILEDRNRLVKPVIFLIFSSFVYTVLQQVLRFEDGYIKSSGHVPESASAAIAAWIQGNYGYANIIMSIFVALWIKILFRKYKYNIFELLILLFFIFGMGMLIFSVFGVLESITKLNVWSIGGLAGIIYSAWAIGQFFDGKIFKSYFKGFLSYLLGFISFILVSICVGLLIDLLYLE